MLWGFLQAVLVVALGFSDMETGPGGAGVSVQQPNGDRFKIEGRAVVPGVKTQDWVSSARIFVEGEEFVGFVRARLVNYIKTSEVIRQPYPLQIRANGPQTYFMKRETWGWTDFLMNPMVMMMVLPLLIIVLLPKVVNTNDPEMRKEMEQSMNMLNPNPELPDVSELMTKLFSGGSKPSSKAVTSKGTRPAVKRR
ncbi:hypothetical protein F7725_019820 [Dissostichus mawsoni]|uniref:Endoplasmic reticulum membrane protein complex subunit 7 n=1 Tax=Dissostichus mawsoni TaxID=36200 RepID=A0A7J5YM77_DISMA|nr:hypothetical protein F7725_019820 [Dissostichus mawsoni]